MSEQKKVPKGISVEIHSPPPLWHYGMFTWMGVNEARKQCVQEAACQMMQEHYQLPWLIDTN
jgi:hypothetical protein